MYVGRYINLDRSRNRREALEQQLQRFGVAERYERFAAVDGAALPANNALSPGQVGCFLSHYEVLKSFVGRGVHLHIMEDDTVIGPQTFPVLDQVIEFMVSQHDVTYTNVSINLNLLLLLDLLGKYRASGMDDRRPASPKDFYQVSLGATQFMATSSYIVRADVIPRLVDALATEIAAGPRSPIDVFYHELFAAGRFTAGCTVPFLTSVQGLDFTSTIDARARPLATVSYLIREVLFIDRDQAGIDRALASLELPPALGVDALKSAMDYLLSPKFALP